MRTDAPPRIYLKDYRPPEHLIDKVALDIRLTPKETRVKAQLAVRANPATADRKAPLVLNGEAIELTGLTIDGVPVAGESHVLSDDTLTVLNLPDGPFTLGIETVCDPSANTELSGLYLSNDVYCTQCEAEGFRRITFFPDRPDVLSVYTVRIEADKARAPVLLANGNPVERGEVKDTSRHFAVWHDPFPKPSYLFALVAGDLARLSEPFVTASGRDVELNIYVEQGKQDRCGYAMEALKRAMRWDEERFGREYDLDVFNIVAVSDFNMGAMENKGLNIFNDKFILASPETATDMDFANIEAIVAHEYFHNWTGNRITCRDWFQLCLKEGLTVFRDQEFSADMRSRAVERIGDVRLLRSHQFPEDAGPLAHPVRPSSFSEINNFYTATVYEKGAELVRMVELMLGEDRFAAGVDLYFDRYDGTAATVEQFIGCFEEAGAVDLSQFMLWYEQAGTPRVSVKSRYDETAKELTVDITQALAPTPGQADKKPHHIPMKMGLIGANGDAIPLTLAQGARLQDDVVHLTEQRHRLTFVDVPSKPVLSLFRGFSAPVAVDRTLSPAELLFLARHDADSFNRWQAVQSYALQWLKRIYEALGNGSEPPDDTDLAAVLAELTQDDDLEAAFRAMLLQLPGETELSMEIASNVDPALVHRAVVRLRRRVGDVAGPTLDEIYARYRPSGAFAPDAASAGQRALRNTALSLLTASGTQAAAERAAGHYRGADNMTDMIAALTALAHMDQPQRESLLEAFYERFRADPLVVDKWLMLQATATRPDTAEHVERLTTHTAFSWRNPNRVRALIGAFAMHNLPGFHRADGAGYRLVCDAVLRLDGTNPQVAARLLGSFKSWRMLEAGRRTLARQALEDIAKRDGLSRDVREIAARSLDAPEGNAKSK